MPDGLVAGELQAGLASGAIGREIIVLEQTGSTNDAILQIANANSKEGLVVFAEHQTAGRGRRGNAIDGNRQQEKDFGFPFFCDRRSIPRVRRDLLPGRPKPFPVRFKTNFP